MKFALEVQGEAMEPCLLEGDIVVVDPYQKPRSNAQDIAVLRIKGNHHVCRFTRFGNQVLLLHDNAPIITVRAADVEVIGKVINEDFTPLLKENQLAENELAFA